MTSAKQIIKHLTTMLLSLTLLSTTLLISQPVEFPERKISLGYPIHFYTLDFGSPYTSMGGAPDEVLQSRRFNILSSWEEYAQFSWSNFVISYVIIFLGIESATFVIHLVNAG